MTRRSKAQLNGNIHQRAIDLSDDLDCHGDWNRDQRIAFIRHTLIRENARGYQRGFNAAKAEAGER